MDDDQPLTKEDLLRIASEVWAGERPESDLEKYGISLGPTTSGDEAKQQLLAELEALGEEDADDVDAEEALRELLGEDFDDEEE